MSRFEYRVYRVKLGWDGGDYYLAATVQKEEFQNADRLGDEGWEFVAFVPNPEPYLTDSFSPEEVELTRLAVFKRTITN